MTGASGLTGATDAGGSDGPRTSGSTNWYCLGQGGPSPAFSKARSELEESRQRLRCQAEGRRAYLTKCLKFTKFLLLKPFTFHRKGRGPVF